MYPPRVCTIWSSPCVHILYTMQCVYKICIHRFYALQCWKRCIQFLISGGDFRKNLHAMITFCIQFFVYIVYTLYMYTLYVYMMTTYCIQFSNCINYVFTSFPLCNAKNSCIQFLFMLIYAMFMITNCIQEMIYIVCILYILYTSIVIFWEILILLICYRKQRVFYYMICKK